MVTDVDRLPMSNTATTSCFPFETCSLSNIVFTAQRRCSLKDSRWQGGQT